MKIKLYVVKEGNRNWHSWFAWRPVVANRYKDKPTLVWLETIDRRLYESGGKFEWLYETEQ